MLPVSFQRVWILYHKTDAFSVFSWNQRLLLSWFLIIIAVPHLDIEAQVARLFSYITSRETFTCQYWSKNQVFVSLEMVSLRKFLKSCHQKHKKYKNPMEVVVGIHPLSFCLSPLNCFGLRFHIILLLYLYVILIILVSLGTHRFIRVWYKCFYHNCYSEKQSFPGMGRTRSFHPFLSNLRHLIMTSFQNRNISYGTKSATDLIKLPQSVWRPTNIAVV